MPYYLIEIMTNKQTKQTEKMMKHNEILAEVKQDVLKSLNEDLYQLRSMLDMMIQNDSVSDETWASLQNDIDLLKSVINNMMGV